MKFLLLFLPMVLIAPLIKLPKGSSTSPKEDNNSKELNLSKSISTPLENTFTKSHSYVGEGTYIDENAGSVDDSPYILYYSNLPGANRPSIEVEFTDGTELYFNAVGEGDYPWIILNEDMEEIGTMKLVFSSNKLEGNIRIRKNENAANYTRPLALLQGNIWWIP
ncbi:MAG: hypothetical protein ACK444_05430 [Flavobacteriales bacterium]|jgi:hypothetical protein